MLGGIKHQSLAQIIAEIRKNKEIEKESKGGEYQVKAANT